MSPHNLLQEQQVGKPDEVWRILVVCSLLNRTHGRGVRLMVDKIFERWPNPKAMAECDRDELAALIKPLGFSKRRSSQLRQMSIDLGQGLPVFACCGCGPYAVASVKIFVQGMTVPTDDQWLGKYLEWRSNQPGVQGRVRAV